MKVSILGCGAYGIALASIFNSNNVKTYIWDYNKENAKLVSKSRVSDKLSDYVIPKDIVISNNLKRVVKESNLVVIAVPAFAVDETSKKLSKYIEKDMHILIATKGIENDTCLFLTDVVGRYINTNKFAVIAGPTFAKDIVSGSFVGLSIATTNNKTKTLVKNLMENDKCKLRETTDVIGVEVCSSIKNVMAIASGMLGGMNVSDSTKALFLTEALNDIKELIDALDGNKKTILSFAGFGDILMTCTSETSRNYSFGKLIGEGKLDEAKEYSIKNTVEGLYTLKSIKELIKRENVKMSIIDLISDIIMEKVDKNELLNFLIKKK